MSNVPSINTSTYLKSRNIEIDGFVWTLKAPGAREELSMSQAQRRIKRLDQKIEERTATDQDYDLYDKLEAQSYSMFKNIFKDTTADNSQVNNWLEETPLGVVMQIFQDIKKQLETKDEDVTTGTAI